MAKCNQLTSLPFKGLNHELASKSRKQIKVSSYRCRNEELAAAQASVSTCEINVLNTQHICCDTNYKCHVPTTSSSLLLFWQKFTACTKSSRQLSLAVDLTH